MDVVYTEEQVKPLYKEISRTTLLQDHFKEVGFGHYEIDIKANIKELLKMEKRGEHAVFVCRDCYSGTIIGYIGFVINNNLFFSVKTAQAYITYIRPDFRGRGVASSLVRFAESVLYHTKRCRFIQLTSNTNKEIGQFIEKQGYTATDKVYTKGFEDYSTSKESLQVQKECIK